MHTAGRHLKTLHRRCIFARYPRNNFSGMLGNHWALEITGRACSEATQRSKLLLELAPFSSTALENKALARLIRTLHSTSLFGRARQPLGVRGHGSGVLRSHFGSALQIAARASLWVFDGTSFSLRNLAKSLRCELGIASSCALHELTSTLRYQKRI